MAIGSVRPPPPAEIDPGGNALTTGALQAAPEHRSCSRRRGPQQRSSADNTLHPASLSRRLPRKATRHASPPSAPGATVAVQGVVAAAGNPAACAWPLLGDRASGAGQGS